MSLVVRNLSKDYPTPSGPLPVLRSVDLEMRRGDAVAVMGPSGSGKSTLLHVLGTLDQPTSGSVRLDDKDPFALKERDLADFRNRHVGFVFQDHYLLPQCTLLENVLIPSLVSAMSRAEAEAHARQLLTTVGLGDRFDHRPAEVSGGQRQRAAIARALVLKPSLVLADEPTGNLDRTSAHGVGDLLLSLTRDQAAMLVVVTHSPELARLFPKTLVMDDGTLHAAAGGGVR